MRGGPTGTCHVVAIPYPGRGHVNPLMNLCKALASRKPGIFITFVLTDEWLGLIGDDADEPKPPNMVFDTIPNVVPSERVRAKDMVAFTEAVFTKMEAPFEHLLDRLHLRPDLIIADTFLFWAVGVGNRRRIPVASFWPMSALAFYMFHHLHLLQQNGRHIPFDLLALGNADGFVDCIPGIPSLRAADLPRVVNEKVLQRIMELFSWVPKGQYILLTSVYELEHQIIHLLEADFPFPTYAIGPCIPYRKLEDEPSLEAAEHAGVDYLLWLDRQPRTSVLYISQGSFLSVSREQLDDMAAGLRDSKVRFLWVGREESSRVKELCGETGMVVPWCDQLKVLSHPSVGGFWTHCGWNSVKEGVFSGVPFLTFPIVMDQVPNSRLVVEDWKIGWRVTDKSRQGIAGLVWRFMDLQDEQGRDMRRRATRLQEVCRTSVGKYGSSETSLNSFIEKIIRKQWN